jgi:seryl-tRNA synthetase
MCTGDIGTPNAKKYDLEAWLPGQNKYRELASCSHDTDFQARRLNIKYRDGKKKELVHTMNSTACAVGRTLIAIYENYQDSEGNIRIPEVLLPYMNGINIISAKKDK